jgi:hypothetical protein
MNDDFLKEARQEPRPEFARSLRERLRAQESTAPARRALPRLSPALGAFAALLVVVALFSLPAVRASAQAFLDLFRVRNFAAVTVDAERMQRLKQLRGQQIDMGSILGTPQVVQDAGPLRDFTDVAKAARATGCPLRQPVGMAGFTADTTFVRGESRERMTVDTGKLRELLTALAIDDVQVPPGLDGAQVDVHIAPVARTTWRNQESKVVLVQAPSPELSLPAGVDAAQLGEIGLRVAGLSAAEARRFAGTIDWHSTMLVPVPSVASSFREVDVRGHKGLLVTKEARQDLPRRPHGGSSQLMWSDGERVYALVGSDISDVKMLQLANAVQ